MPIMEKFCHTHCRPGRGLNQKLVMPAMSGMSSSPMTMPMTPATMTAGTNPALLIRPITLFLLWNFTLPNPLANSRNRPRATPMDQEMG